MNPEGEVSSFKINWFIANQNSIFKTAWRAQFLRHTLVHKTKNVYFFRMYKWYYYHILIFLLASDLEKSLGSLHSRVQSSLTYHTNPSILDIWYRTIYKSFASFISWWKFLNSAGICRIQFFPPSMRPLVCIENGNRITLTEKCAYSILRVIYFPCIFSNQLISIWPIAVCYLARLKGCST